MQIDLIAKMYLLIATFLQTIFKSKKIVYTSAILKRQQTFKITKI